MNGESNNSKELIVWLLGISFLGFVYSFISAAAWEMFVERQQDTPSIYILAGVWVVLLFLYFKNQEDGLQKMKDLCGLTGLGFLYAIGSLAVLGMLLQWILEIDITEMRYAYRLGFLTWGGWVIGMHFYFKAQDEKETQEQEVASELAEGDPTIRAFQKVGAHRKVPSSSEPPISNDKN